MAKKNNRKKFVILSVVSTALLLIGCVWYFSGWNIRHPDVLPEGSEKETSLNDISYEKDLEFPETTSAKNDKNRMQIYKNRMNEKDSLRRAAQYLDLEVSDFVFREESAITMFDRYDVPGGECAVEKATGYWQYVSDGADEIQAAKEREFPSDGEIIDAARTFLLERKIFEKDEYTVSVGAATQGNGDAGELVLAKDVYIYPLINGCEVFGVYRLILSFDAEGEIFKISSYYNPAKEYQSAELKSEQEAKKSFREGRYSSSTTEPLYDVKIEKVSLAYYSDAEPDEGGFLLFPVYVFYGTGHPAGSEERVSFDAIVDAMKD